MVGEGQSPIPLCVSAPTELLLNVSCQPTHNRRVGAREYKSREVAQSPIYVIVHSLLEVSFGTQPFPTPSGWLW